VARATVLLGHSAALHSHAKPPPHFVGPGLCFAKPLFGPPKRRKQPGRYAKCPKIFQKSLDYCKKMKYTWKRLFGGFMNFDYPVLQNETALTNVLFWDIDRTNNFKKLLADIQWKDHASLPFSVQKVCLCIPFKISEFGTVDVLLFILDSDGKYHVVVIECKLDTYEKSICKTTSKKYFDETGNMSAINNQMALRFRFFIKYKSLKNDEMYKLVALEEEKHSVSSPYEKDSMRICKHPQTLDMLKEIKSDFDDFYLVALTSDKTAPFTEMENTIPFYEDKAGLIPFNNLGFLNWDVCKSVLDGTDSKFPKSMEHYFNSAITLDDKECSRYIIKSKSVSESLLLFRNKNNSFTVRSYKGGKCSVIKNASKDKKAYESFIKDYKFIKKTPYHKISDTKFWENELKIA
jgi:hypothetical protein